MHTEQQHRHHSHHGCHESSGGQSSGSAWLYGYSHDSGQMKLMDYPEYMGNVQTTYSKLYPGLASAFPSTAQPYAAPAQGYQQQQQPAHHHHAGHHHKDCGCGCHEHDCHCDCCIRCADAVEFARCGEVRQIPITFDNDTRRERDVKLELSAFTGDSGKVTGWLAALSETEFKLPPCGHKTVLLRVAVECGTDTQTGTPGTTANPNPTLENQPPATVIRNPAGTVDKCTVGYATVRAEGCAVRPLVIAVAVLPNDCGAHSVGCGCGCCS